MASIKFVLFVFIIYQNIQVDICFANELTKGLEDEASSRIQRSAKSVRVKETSLYHCPSNEEFCRFANIYRRLIENKRKCCRARYRTCKRKFFKTCRKPKCYKKQSSKCLRRLKKCNKSQINPRTMRRRSKLRQCEAIRFPKRKPSTPTKSTAKEVEDHQFSTKKRLKERCVHNDDCEEGLCCAQHHRVKICKRMIQEGQVCTRTFFSRKRSPDVFERCPCAGSLVCARTESQHNTCQVPT